MRTSTADSAGLGIALDLRRRLREGRLRLEEVTDCGQCRVTRQIAIEPARVADLRYEADVGEPHGRSEQLAPVGGPWFSQFLESDDAFRDTVLVPAGDGPRAFLSRSA